MNEKKKCWRNPRHYCMKTQSWKIHRRVKKTSNWKSGMLKPQPKDPSVSGKLKAKSSKPLRPRLQILKKNKNNNNNKQLALLLLKLKDPITVAY
jgi:hypothetical protein